MSIWARFLARRARAVGPAAKGGFPDIAGRRRIRDPPPCAAPRPLRPALAQAGREAGGRKRFYLRWFSWSVSVLFSQFRAKVGCAGAGVNIRRFLGLSTAMGQAPFPFDGGGGAAHGLQGVWLMRRNSSAMSFPFAAHAVLTRR
jgi:hypothetical protein